MALYRNRGTGSFRYDFRWNGQRYRGNTFQTNRRDAALAEANAKARICHVGGARERKVSSRPTLRNLYFIQCGDAVKIGVATSVLARLATLQTGSPQPLILLGSVKASPADERALHRHLADFRLAGEWFRATDETLGVIRDILARYGRGGKSDLGEIPE